MKYWFMDSRCPRIGIHRIVCYCDSDLVVQQFSSDWDASMASYRFHVQQINCYFEDCEFHHIPRAKNEAADTLSKLGSSRQSIPVGISLQHIRKPSIKPSPESKSICISADPEPDVAPMEIDADKNHSISANPRTAQSDPGTSQPVSMESMSVEPMSVDEAMSIVRVVPSGVQLTISYMISVDLPRPEEFKEDQSLHHHQRRNVPKKCHRHALALCRARTRARNTPRYPSRRRWSSCFIKGSSCQNILACFLLTKRT
jgi:hypothetical protein